MGKPDIRSPTLNLLALSESASYHFHSCRTVFFQPSDNNNYIRAEAATCYGTSPCTACSNCSSCKHCKSGVTCGVCEKPRTKKAARLHAPSSGGQCKAMTKKGTRCSRSATS